MDAWQERLKSLIDAKGTTPNKVKEATKINISRLLTTRQDPRISTIQALADYLGTTTAYILEGTEGVKSFTSSFEEIPLVRWDQLWSYLRGTFMQKKFFPFPGNPSKKCFAVEVTTKTFEPAFSQGDIVFVDPLSQPSPGAIVLISLSLPAGGEAFDFRKFEIGNDGEIYFSSEKRDLPGGVFLPLKKGVKIEGVVIGKFVGTSEIP